MTEFYTTFIVEVRESGRVINEHTITAADALIAINMVELTYGEPPKAEWKTVTNKDGKSETRLIVAGWHGYTFEARPLMMELS